MALPRDITSSSLTAVHADADTGALGAMPLLMPRYSLSYDIGLGGVGVDAFAPALTRVLTAHRQRSGVVSVARRIRSAQALGVDTIAPRYVREVVDTEMAHGRRVGWRGRIQRADVLGAYPMTAVLLGDARGDEMARLQSQLDDLARSMKQAQAGVDKQIPGQAEALASFKAQYRSVSHTLAVLRERVSASEKPGNIATALDSFSDQVLAPFRALGNIGTILPIALGVGVVGYLLLKGNR